MASKSFSSLLAWFWLFRPDLGGFFLPVFGSSDLLYKLAINICEMFVICVQPTNCYHGFQESL